MNIETILDALNKHKVRATYSTVGELVGVHPKVLASILATVARMRLGLFPRRPGCQLRV